MSKKFLVAFWTLFILGISSVFILFYMIGKGQMGYMPSFQELENPNNSLATEVISTDKVVIGRYYIENRSNITYDNINPNLRNALLATEDIRFFDHTGVDIRALFRVFKGVVTHNLQGGGSTVTQQLAKNLFPRKKLSTIQLVFQKLKEWIIAVKLERSYTKEEIMAMYFNTVPFSDNAFGVKSAANVYFGKPVDSLKVEEAAVLVGMLKAPSQYNPHSHPEAAMFRRNTVLDQMRRYKFITNPQYDSLSKLPITLDFHGDSHTDGEAPYFREYLRLWLKDWCNTHRKPDGTAYNIYTDGLKIYTTIDSRLQRFAEQAQREHLTEMQKIFTDYWSGKDPWKDFPKEWENIYHQCPRYIDLKSQGKSEEEIDKIMKTPIKMTIFSYDSPNEEKDTIMSPFDSIRYHRTTLQNGFMAVDPESGYIRVWVGGVNYKYFQYDHVNINTKRQIGSTFKPFVYTVAIRDKGYSPCFRVPNQPVTFEAGDPRFHLLSDWTPRNADGKYGGTLSLKQGLANSINTVTAYLMHEMSPNAVIKLVQTMGVKSDIPDQPSICLGTADISLFEMLGAYTTYANKGVHVTPIFVTRIEDKNGNVLQDFIPEKNEALDEQTTYVMIEMLRNVIAGGTGARVRYRFKLMNDIIGKTGTTQNYSDGWFIGCTPDLIAGSWVGCDDRYIRFRSMQNGQGASTALPIWAKFFQKVYSDSAEFKTEIDPDHRFEAPEGKLTIEMNCDKYTKGGVINQRGNEYE
jgi:penicillin-binding protein 1A